jgi:CDP-diacylglycerol---glycerol-3-phosphate 3-phosphatidyltransferase
MNLQRFSDNLIATTILPIIPSGVTPNQVTWVRIISLPFIFYLLKTESYLWGLIIFSLSALTDAIDGAMARKRGQITETGKVLDAVADRGLITLVALVFIPKYFGWRLFLMLMALEALNAAMAYRWKRKMGRNFGANWAGKVKMILQSAAFIIIFAGILKNSALLLKEAEILLYLSLILTLWQSFLYSEKESI